MDDLDRVAPTINAPSQGGFRYDADQVETLVVERHGLYGGGTTLRARPGDVAGTLTERSGSEGYDRGTFVVEPEWHGGSDLRLRPADTAPTLTGASTHTDRGVLVEGFTLHGRDGGNMPDPFSDIVPGIGAANGGSTRPFIYIKRGRAQHEGDAESWDVGDVAPTLNIFDGSDVRATVAIDGTEVDDDPLLPDGLDTNRYRLTGNGVAAPVATWLGLRLRETLEGSL